MNENNTQSKVMMNPNNTIQREREPAMLGLNQLNFTYEINIFTKLNEWKICPYIGICTVKQGLSSLWGACGVLVKGIHWVCGLIKQLMCVHNFMHPNFVHT